MRQIHIHTDPSDANAVMRICREHEARFPVCVEARNAQGSPRSIALLEIANERVGALVEAISREVEDAQFTLIPRGTLPIDSRLEQLDESVRAVSQRSTLELVIASLQSLGSWKGMLMYAAFSGITAAYGMVVGAGYILVAAMLIAPMGAPAMVCVIGAAIGDWRMVRDGAIRFWVAVIILALTAYIFGAAYGLEQSTMLMQQIASLSIFTVLVAMVGGGAGAQAQIQSDRDSLVSGTVAGFLVAVALSPPSAVLGLGLWLGRWEYVRLMSFVVTLTFFAVILGGWLSLQIFQVHPDQLTMRRGSNRNRWVAAGIAAMVSLGLLGWQYSSGDVFRQADAARDAERITRRAVDAVPGARYVSAEANFTRAQLERGPGEELIVEVLFTHPSDVLADSAENAVRRSVTERLRAAMPHVVSFVVPTAVAEPPATIAR